MKIAYQTLIGVLALPAILPLLAISQCTPQEVCDGIDNDNDGQIDEDFDEDLDGHYSADECSYGDDCNDLDPNVHPNAAEPVDGVDNDCDGKVDESQQAYVVRFLRPQTNEPVTDLPVWPGTDGSGPVENTDDTGEVVFFLESAYDAITYNSHSSAQPNPFITIFSSSNTSYVNLRPSTDETYYFTDSSAGSSITTSGNVTGIDTAVPEGASSDVTVYVVGNDSYCSSDLGSVTAESMAYSLSCSYSGWIFAKESFLDPETYESIYGGDLPYRVGLTLGSGASQDVNLDRSLTDKSTFTVSNVDTSMVTANRNRYLAPSGYSLYLDVGSDSTEAIGNASYDISTYPLSGSFAGSNYLLDLEFGTSAGDMNQWIELGPTSSSTGSLSSSLLPVPIVNGYSATTTASVPGSSFDVTNDSEGDSNVYIWYSAYDNLDGNEICINVWDVVNENVGKAVTVPEIPATFTEWPAGTLEEGNYEDNGAYIAMTSFPSGSIVSRAALRLVAYSDAGKQMARAEAKEHARSLLQDRAIQRTFGASERKVASGERRE